MTLAPIPGNTFPVKELLKAIGAKWNIASRVWEIDSEKLSEAVEIVSPSKKVYAVNRWIDAGPVYVRAAGKKEALAYALGNPPLKEEKDWCHIWDMWINHRRVPAVLAPEYENDKTLKGVRVVPSEAQQIAANRFSGTSFVKVNYPKNIATV